MTEQQTQQTQPTQPAAQPAAQAQPEPGAEFRSMSPEAFAARLKAERDAGLKAALSSLNVDSIDTAKARLEALAKAEQAQLTEQQRLQKQLEELAPLAAKAKAYEATIAATLAAEESALPEAKRSLLALAPESPAERLAWLAKAKAQGLFADAASAAAQPATTRAGGTAPAPSQPTPAKAPKDMTTTEVEAYKRQLFGG